MSVSPRPEAAAARARRRARAAATRGAPSALSPRPLSTPDDARGCLLDKWRKSLPASFVPLAQERLGARRLFGPAVHSSLREELGRLPCEWRRRAAPLPARPPADRFAAPPAARREDLAKLDSIDDAAVMQTLQQRHEKDEIYTKNGAVLIAINPYKAITCYEQANLAQYKGAIALEREPPHIFAVSAAAHRTMISTGNNQAVVISGESGAGKTETARFVLLYLRYVSNTGDELERRIADSQPLTEAFGCAKTLRNDNSSRFGKFLKLHFDVSAKIKVRAQPPPADGASRGAGGAVSGRFPSRDLGGYRHASPHASWRGRAGGVRREVHDKGRCVRRD
eukprot:2042643-Prymnesium_polylepis.1